MAVEEASGQQPETLAGGEADHEQLPHTARVPLVQAKMPESMSAYFQRLRRDLKAQDFEVVKALSTDGLYIGKRPIRGAQGQGELLNQAGTVFHHTLLYVKSGNQVTALDFGPHGSADVTANVMEAVPCGPVVHPDTAPEEGQVLVHVKLSHISLDSASTQKALQFVQNRKYHAINNNCIHNTDFFCRVLTAGKVRNAPLIFDALAGKVPEQDHPMLLMFFLMTQLSWFHVCDGSPLTAAFMEHVSPEKSAEKALSAADVASREAHNTPGTPSQQGRLDERQIDLASLAGLMQASEFCQASMQ